MSKKNSMVAGQWLEREGLYNNYVYNSADDALKGRQTRPSTLLQLYSPYQYNRLFAVKPYCSLRKTI